MLEVISLDLHSGPRQTLKSHHLQMIALGGVIGASLFVGSGVVVHRGSVLLHPDRVFAIGLARATRA